MSADLRAALIRAELLHAAIAHALDNGMTAGEAADALHVAGRLVDGLTEAIHRKPAPDLDLGAIKRDGGPPALLREVQS